MKRVKDMRETMRQYNVPLDEIQPKGNEWRFKAQCLGRDPREYELTTHKGPSDKQTKARELCRGCPVVKECAGEAVDPIAQGTVRAGVWIPDSVTRHYHRQLKESLIEIALGEVLAEDLIDRLERIGSLAKGRARVSSAGGPAPAAPLPPRRGVGARG